MVESRQAQGDIDEVIVHFAAMSVRMIVRRLNVSPERVRRTLGGLSRAGDAPKHVPQRTLAVKGSGGTSGDESQR